MYSWLSQLALNEHFTSVLPLTDKQIDEQYHVELVLRFFALKDVNLERFKGGLDIGEFLTTIMKEMALDPDFNMEEQGQVLIKTFRLLDVALGENAFKKYQNDRYTGAFSLSIFEVVGLGLGYSVENYAEDDPAHITKIKNVSEHLLENPDFVRNSGSGAKASSRLPHILPLGRELFAV